MRKFAGQSYGNASSLMVETVLRRVIPVQPETQLEEISARFSGDESLLSIPVVKNDRPVGLISRHEFVDKLARSSSSERTGEVLCMHIMDAQPLLVERSMPLHELSGFLSESGIRHFAEGFIVTEQGRYIGIGSGQDLLRKITSAHMEAARYANPLTSLPGYVPVNAHIEHLLQSRVCFAVCHADLDNLKPYNDVCGYSKGDELIRFTARLLCNICDPVHDYIGHTGGDDFIVILQSRDWEQRCHRALSAFARTSPTMFDKDHLTFGGYLTGDRKGRIVHHPLPTLSLGVAWVIPEFFGSHHQVAEAAAAAKQMAREKPGNSLFVERRRPQLREMTGGQPRGAEAHYG
ncbi:MAG: diguanylate cyclase [Gallionella sp.]